MSLLRLYMCVSAASPPGEYSTCTVIDPRYFARKTIGQCSPCLAQGGAQSTLVDFVGSEVLLEQVSVDDGESGSAKTSASFRKNRTATINASYVYIFTPASTVRRRIPSSPFAVSSQAGRIRYRATQVRLRRLFVCYG